MALLEPSPRLGHHSAAVGGQLYVFGGRTKGFLEERRELAACVHSFNQCRETWQTKATTGSPPPGLYRGSCTSSSSAPHIYLYGGWDVQQQHDSLHQLNIDSLEWTQLPSGPMRKAGCGMVSYEDQLILFGGYGVPSGPTQPGAEFMSNKRTDGRGWTNELHSYHLKEGEGE